MCACPLRALRVCVVPMWLWAVSRKRPPLIYLRYLFSGGDDAVVMQWNIKTGELVRSFVGMPHDTSGSPVIGHSDSVPTVCADEHHLFSGKRVRVLLTLSQAPLMAQ